MNLFVVAVVILAAFAVFDLIVGVSNDAVNFLNASIGSGVASRRVIMLVASFGILLGVTFSGGMMEVARKGIFHPGFFTMPELLTLFLAVMITDVILLDFFSSHGLPTSTTVSVVFELLGAALAISILKILSEGASLALLGEYINTARALLIISGIFLSIVVSFLTGTVVQFISRLIFTFDYTRTLHKYGAVWGGVALTSITYFILVKGAKSASFMTPATVDFIHSNSLIILLGMFVIATLLLQMLILLKVNILKPIVLIGTFALAMAFAGNDLVNFIGVPIAGYNAYHVAAASTSMTTATMEALGGKVATSTALLLLAGAIMTATLWVSRKARSVTNTSVALGQQEEGLEQFSSSFLSRSIVRFAISILAAVQTVSPRPVRRWVAKRLDTGVYRVDTDKENRPSFDLLRAATSLMVASALISYATSHKLPLSTTYVTFMVLMGASFADRAWGRESAVYRVTGVLTVIGGWFLTAFAASAIGGLFAAILYLGKGYALAGLLAIVGLMLWNNHKRYVRLAQFSAADSIFNLRKVTDVSMAVSATFEHVSQLLEIIRHSLDATLNALYEQDGYRLSAEVRKTRKVRQWADIIIANVFKSLRLLQQKCAGGQHNYAQVVRRMQKLADGYCDIVIRSSEHVANHHKGLLREQVEELRSVQTLLLRVIDMTRQHIAARTRGEYQDVVEALKELKQLGIQLQCRQLDRIATVESKTRLSILYFAILGNAHMLANQCRHLLEIFADSFLEVKADQKVFPE